jgi:hypothetical protein
VKLSVRLAFALFLFSAQSFADPFSFQLPSVDGFEGSVVIVDTEEHFQVEVKGSLNPSQNPAGRRSLGLGYPDSNFQFTLRLGFRRVEVSPWNYPFSTFVQIESDNPGEVLEWIRAKGLEIAEMEDTNPVRLNEIERQFGANVRYGLVENAARFSELSPRDTRAFFFLMRNYFQNMADLFDEKAGVAAVANLFQHAGSQMHLPDEFASLWAGQASQVYKEFCGKLADMFSRVLASRTLVPDATTDVYEFNIPAGTRPGPDQLFGSLDLRIEGVSFLNLQSSSGDPGLIPTPLAETVAAGLKKYLLELERLREQPNPVRGPEIMRAVAAALNACADAVEKAGKEKI